MKSLSIILIFVIIIILVPHKATAKYNINLGLMAGKSKNKLSGSYINYESRFQSGLNLGFLFMYNIKNNFAIRSGISYSSRGGHDFDKDYSLAIKTLIQKWLDVPLLIQYSLFKIHLFKTYITGGLAISFFQSGEDIHGCLYNHIVNIDKINPNYSFIIGAGLIIKNHVFFEFQYNKSLKNVYERYYSKARDLFAKQHSFSINIGFFVSI
ncbi:MAG: porin family protein [Candidatus Helarchaeota archaeon]